MLLDFAHCNIYFNIKQLVEVLRCNLQVAIHRGLTEAQANILKVIAGFIDHFHIEVMTLSAPHVHALLDHMCARCAGSHSFLAAVRQGTTSTRPESFLKRGPTNLLQSFLDRLPDHQTNLDRGSTHPIKLETKVNQFGRTLQTCMVDVTSNPALMQ